MFFLQILQTGDQRGGDSQIFILRLVLMSVLGSIDGYIHLLYGSDNSLRLLRHLILFGSDKANLVMECFGKGGE